MCYPFFPFKMIHGKDEQVRILSPYSEENIAINTAAACLLKLSNGSKSLEEIIAKLCNHFNSTEDEIRARTMSCIKDFESSGLLWIKKEKMRWFDAPPPDSIFWEITNECNLRCLHCVVSAERKHENELSTQEGLALLNEWRDMRVREITFSGGEPLIRKDFFQLAHAARRNNLAISLATNGTLITPAIADELKTLQASIQVSLDGSTSEIYSRVRGSEIAFDQAIKGIEILVRAGHEITIGTLISMHNVDDIPNMLKLVQRLGAKRFRLIPFIPNGRGKSNSTLELPPERVKAVYTYLLQQRGKWPFEIAALEFEHTFSEPPHYRIDQTQPSECGGALNYCTVTPIGEVLPCHYFEGVTADSVKNQQFSYIWKHSRFLNYFRSLQISDISGYCRQCEWLSVCRGGCKAANFAKKTLFHSNRHCWLVTENKNVHLELDSE